MSDQKTLGNPASSLAALPAATCVVGHTPGPWRVLWNGAVGPNDRSVVCKPDGASIDEAKANARLIAAAPDLLAALKRIVADSDDLDRMAMPEAYEIVDAAIAKADGRS